MHQEKDTESVAKYIKNMSTRREQKRLMLLLLKRYWWFKLCMVLFVAICWGAVIAGILNTHFDVAIKRYEATIPFFLIFWVGLTWSISREFRNPPEASESSRCLHDGSAASQGGNQFWI
jgi:hypothetical protein